MNGGPGHKLGGPESWTVPPPWKLYFNPCANLTPLSLLVDDNKRISVNIRATAVKMGCKKLFLGFYKKNLEAKKSKF